VRVSETFTASDFTGSNAGVIIVPVETPADYRGIGRWYRKFFGANVYALVKSGLPEGTRFTGEGTFTVGLGSFLDTFRDTLRNNRLQGTGGTYFLDHHEDSGIGPVTYMKDVGNNVSGAYFPFLGRKLVVES